MDFCGTQATFRPTKHRFRYRCTMVAARTIRLGCGRSSAASEGLKKNRDPRFDSEVPDTRSSTFLGERSAANAEDGRPSTLQRRKQFHDLWIQARGYRYKRSVHLRPKCD